MTAALTITIYSIALYGLSNIVVFGSGPFRIFERIREWSYSVSEHFHLLFSCMMCLPANLGILCSLFNWFVTPDVAFTPYNILFGGSGYWWLAMCFDSVFTSGIVWLIHNVETFFENITNDDSSSQSENANTTNDDAIPVDDITIKQ